MPEAFNACVAGGGRVRTVKPTSSTYLHVCYPKGGGSPVRGEVKKVKHSASSSAAKEALKRRKGS